MKFLSTKIMTEELANEIIKEHNNKPCGFRMCECQQTSLLMEYVEREKCLCFIHTKSGIADVFPLKLFFKLMGITEDDCLRAFDYKLIENE